MSTQVATLRTVDGAIVRPINGEGDLEIVIEHQFDLRRAAQATDGVSTISVPESAVEEYQSIQSLKGLHANDPSWDDLPAFLETYWREIDETVETD